MCVCLFFRTGDNVSLVDVKTAFSMIGKFGIAGAFNIVYLYGPEIFPTTLRCRWFASLWAHLVGLVSCGYEPPFILFPSTWSDINFA